MATKIDELFTFKRLLRVPNALIDQKPTDDAQLELER